jgi:hypothetical protein
MMAVMAAPQAIKAWKYDPSAPENATYYSVSLEQRITYGAFYIGLAAFLAIMTHDVHQMLGNFHQSPN